MENPMENPNMVPPLTRRRIPCAHVWLLPGSSQMSCPIGASWCLGLQDASTNETACGLPGTDEIKLRMSAETQKMWIFCCQDMISNPACEQNISEISSELTEPAKRYCAHTNRARKHMDITCHQPGQNRPTRGVPIEYSMLANKHADATKNAGDIASHSQP